MSNFANYTSNSVSFVLKNVTAPPGRIIKVFNVQVYPGFTIDVMKIPGIAEEDIRASLLKGDLRNKITNGQLKIISSTIGLPEYDITFIKDLGNMGLYNSVNMMPIIPGREKDILNNVANPIISVDISKTIPAYGTLPDNSFGCKLFFAVECTDGNDVQIREGDVNAAVAYKNGSFTTSQAVSATNAITGGTLTTTFSWNTSGTIATLQITPSTNLSVTDLEIHYFLLHATHSSFQYL